MATGKTRTGTFYTALRSRLKPAQTIWEECGLWLSEAVEDVQATAKYLVSGVLLKKVTGRLVNGIFGRTNKLTMTGEVGTSVEEGVIWELYGVTGPIRAGQLTAQKRSKELQDAIQTPGTSRHRAILIAKGSSAKGAIGSQTRFRAATYTRITHKPPVRWLSKALELQMTGPTGSDRLRILGVNSGRIIARNIVDAISQRYPGGVTVRGGSL